MKIASVENFVSVVIPCLNEELPIAAVVREVLAEGVDEVIVVDNGSTDKTGEAARAAGARVVYEPIKGYGRACASGLRIVSTESEIVCFLDGDGSDVASFLPNVVLPIADGTADFVLGSRLRGKREPGSMTAQQIAAGWIAGVLIRWRYGVQFTDMSPFRSMRVDRLRSLNMKEMSYGWNLEMQMRASSERMRIIEIPVDHRCRRGGTSKVSGDLVAGLKAACIIAITFVRLSVALKRNTQSASG
jgi:glycosyltransferase involved in cell wall biosynthesis